MTFTGTNLTILPLWATLNDGSDYLKTEYQGPFTDGVHINDIGRIEIQAAVMRGELVSLGLL